MAWETTVEVDRLGPAETAAGAELLPGISAVTAVVEGSVLGSEVVRAAATSPEVAGGSAPGTASVLVSGGVVPGTEVADAAAAGPEVEGAGVATAASGAAGDGTGISGSGSKVDDAAVGMGAAGAAELVAGDSVAGGEGAGVAPVSAFTGPGR